MEGALISFIAMVVVDIPLFLFMGKLFFCTWGDFWEAITFWFTPDLISTLTGEYWDDLWAEAKLGLFIAICGLCVYGEMWLIVKVFGHLVPD